MRTKEQARKLLRGVRKLLDPRGLTYVHYHYDKLQSSPLDRQRDYEEWRRIRQAVTKQMEDEGAFEEIITR